MKRAFPVLSSLLETDPEADDVAGAAAPPSRHAGRIPLRLPQSAGGRLPAGRAARRGRGRAGPPVRCPSPPPSWTGWGGCASSGRLRRFLRIFPLPARLHAGAHRGRSAVHRGARAAGPRDGLRDPGAGDRQRAAFPPPRPPAVREEGRRRLAAKIRRLCAAADLAAARRFPSSCSSSAAPALLSRLAARDAGDAGHAAAWRVPRHSPTCTARTGPDADRHDGARVSADLPGAWACGCATSRRRRWRTGCRSTAATSASR